MSQRTLTLDTDDVAYLVGVLRARAAAALDRAHRFPAAQQQANRDVRLAQSLVSQSQTGAAA